MEKRQPPINDQSLPERYRFSPAEYLPQLKPLIDALIAEPRLTAKKMRSIQRRHLKDGVAFFSRPEIIAGYRRLAQDRPLAMDEPTFLAKVLRKPVRTLSGVAPITVFTKPYPCPGRCIFCPNDPSMPKSYLADEPVGRRALFNQFDPYLQTWNRLAALHQTGHSVEKAELIVLGGTWSHYPRDYQSWFILRSLQALNEFATRGVAPIEGLAAAEINGGEDKPQTTPQQLFHAQQQNETSRCRMVGLSIETQPNFITQQSVLELRRLGVTKVQLGVQSLDDVILKKNRRDHNTATAAQAIAVLRQAGFKIQLHWMANLLGSTPQQDSEDYLRLFSNPGFRPDELKVYPCALLASADLYSEYTTGGWQPYSQQQLIVLLQHILLNTPDYCRLSRVIRDIPSTNIVAGNKAPNLRQLVTTAMAQRDLQSRDIRSREIRHGSFDPTTGHDVIYRYQTQSSSEYFLQITNGEPDQLLAFCRLSLPTNTDFIAELRGSALIRELHVYGAATGICDEHKPGAQHRGFGKRLLQRAEEIAGEKDYRQLSVISSVGTKPYYRRLGFSDGQLYQHRRLTT